MCHSSRHISEVDIGKNKDLTVQKKEPPKEYNVLSCYMDLFKMKTFYYVWYFPWKDSIFKHVQFKGAYHDVSDYWSSEYLLPSYKNNINEENINNIDSNWYSILS